MDADGRINEVGIAPHCYQDPHPKLYGAFAHSLRTVKFWAREGGKPIVLANDMDFAKMLWQAYADEAADAGRDVPIDERGAWGGLLCIAETREEAQRQAEDHWWYLRQTGSDRSAKLARCRSSALLTT